MEMPRKTLNLVEGGVGGTKTKVRKRGCLSSSSSSSFGHNYRLKRALFVGKRGGSTTPVPVWKIMSSESSSPKSDKAFKYGEKVRELPVSARKLAAILWEINGVPSPRLKRDILEDKTSETGSAGKKKTLETSKLSSLERLVSERTDPAKSVNQRRKVQARPQQLQSICSTRGAADLHSSLVRVYQPNDHTWEQCGHIVGLKTRIKDIYDGLVTSKELFKLLLRHIWRICELDPTSLSLVSALEFELDRACTRLHKLIRGMTAKGNEIDLLKKLEAEKIASGIKEQEQTHRGIASIASELHMQKKLSQRAQKQNGDLGKELLQTKASLVRANKALESEKRAREMAEHVCDELARGIGEDKVEVEEIKRQSAKLREEVEKEREMLQLADMLREERVQMKLLEAKHQFEEKNALVDELRKELEVYLKSRTAKEQRDCSPGLEKIKLLEKYLRDTYPHSDHKQKRDKEDIKTAKKVDQEEDSDDSDLCSIELNVDDLRKSFIWGEAAKNEFKEIPVDESSRRNLISEKQQTKHMDSFSQECITNKPENIDFFGENGFLGFTSHTSKQEIEDEMKRYNMIKDLRDHIVSGSRTASPQDLSSPSRNLGQPGISPNDHDALMCHG